MINCSVKESDSLLYLEVKGHSGFDDIGKDIVCSSVSTVMYMTIGLLDKFDIKYDFKSNEDVPIMILSINKNEINDNSVRIFNTSIELLTGLSDNYPKNLKIKRN